MKVSELTGPKLDAAVAKALGILFVLESCPTNPPKPMACWLCKEDGKPDFAQGLFQPSAVWERAGPIIERERIDLEFMDDGGWSASISEWRPGWLTEHLHEVGVAYGPTPLIAAMRAFVASKLGGEV